MDEFKKYLQQNKEQMDVDTASAELLQRIQKNTAVNKKGRLFTMLVRIAAAACVIAVIFLSMQFLLRKDNKEQKIFHQLPTLLKIISCRLQMLQIQCNRL